MKFLNMIVVALSVFVMSCLIIPLVLPLIDGHMYDTAEEFGWIIIIEIALVSGVVIVLLAEIYFKLEELSKKLSGKQNEESSDCGSGDDG